MKKDEVKVGGVYQVKVSGHLSPVRLDKVSQYGGWDGTNLHTNKSVRIRSAQKLRLEYEPNPIEGAATKWLIKRPKADRIQLAAQKLLALYQSKPLPFDDAMTVFAREKGLTLAELQEGIKAIREQGRMECP